VKLDLGLLADDAVQDVAGKLYILGEFRYIFAQQVPARHGRCAIAARFEAEAVEVRAMDKVFLEIEIVNADGEPTSMPRSPKIPLNFKNVGPAGRGLMHAPLIIKLDGLILGQYGDHRIHFFVNGTACGSVPFHVIQQGINPHQIGGPNAG
jgi:hypothetical protein